MNRCAITLSVVFLRLAQSARAGQLVMQGSATFSDRILSTHLLAIELTAKYSDIE